MTRPVVALLLVLCVCACDRGEQERRYRPGGEYAQRLDSKGRRHIVHDGQGSPFAKLRVDDDEVRVFGADMVLLGSVRVDGGDVEVHRRRGEPQRFEFTSPGVAQLGARVRVEAVERGWVVFDGAGRRLGYFDWREPDRLALRDDYSSAPRVFAALSSDGARTPAGRVAVTAVPPYPAPALLPFALDGSLDALDRLALGAWLLEHRHHAPQPDAADVGDVGVDDAAGDLGD